MKIRVFRLGLDYLVFQFNNAFFEDADDLERLFEGWSDTANQRFNVPFLNYQLDIQFIETRTKKILLFQHRGATVFELVKNSNTQSNRRYSYKCSFYGTYFYFDELSEILLKFAQRYINYIHISRLDIALDCNASVPSLFKKKRTQFRSDQLFHTDGKLTGFYLGSRKGNKKYLIRVYDKKLDSQKKGKFHIFLPYLLEEGVVSRVEAELHGLTLQKLGIIPETIIDYAKARVTGFALTPDCMRQYFASLCMNEQGTYLYPLKSVDFADIERLTISGDPKRTEEIIDKIGYVRRFITMGIRLHGWKLDPIAILKRHISSPFLSPLTEEENNQLFSSSLPF